MPSPVRLKAGTVSLMLITLATISSTIANPLQLGEGEASRTAIESNDAVEFLRNYRFPYQQRRLFQGPNVQVDYRPLVNEAQSDDGSFYLNDELPQQETIKLDDNIELVTPSYVGNVLLMPHGHVEQARYIKPGDRSFEDELNDESSEPEVSLRNEEFADIPTQDVGEQEEQLGSRSELLRADESQNVAYSYSNFIPHYQPVPRQFHFVNDNQPMSFIFHPSMFRNPPGHMVLHELKTLALRLDRSPIMSALFSPATVPISPTLPVWPSKYTAPKYLPPPKASFARPLNDNQSLRRGVIQVQTDKLSPEVLEQLQESLADNNGAFNNFMEKSLNPMSQVFGNFFNKDFQSRLNQGFGSMNHLFNNPNQHFPPAPTDQYQSQQGNNRVSSSVFQGPLSNGFPQFPQIPQLPPIPKQFQMPYISPNLRDLGVEPQVDDIDVRIDKRPDSTVDIQSTNGFQNGSVIQIGSGLKYYDGQHEKTEEMPEDETEQRDISGGDNGDDGSSPNDVQADVDEHVEAEVEVNDELVVMNQVEETKNASEVAQKLEIPEVPLVETTTLADSDFKLHLTTIETPQEDLVETTTLADSEVPRITTIEVPKAELRRNIYDAIMNDLKEALKDGLNEETTESTTEPLPETTTDPSMDETTDSPLNDETTDATTIDPLLETTTFDLEERLDVNVIKSLAG